MPLETVTHDITIKFNPEIQAVDLVFKTEEFKTFEYVLGIIEMARLKGELMRNMAMANQAQQAMLMQAQQEQMVAQQGRSIEKILRGK